MGKKKRSTVDKVIMGAIIGTAVGSVIGLTVAPKKGKETRKILRKRAKNFVDEDVQELGKLAKETTVGLGRLAKRLLKKKQDTSEMKEIPTEEIPTETEEIPEEHHK